MKIKMITRTSVCTAFAGMLFVFGMSSCGEEAPGTPTVREADVAVEIDTAVSERVKQTQNIFYSIPSPVQMSSILRKSGAHYDLTVLSDVKNKDKYAGVQKQALNLGIYGADLSYCSIFNENQETMWYMAASKHLAEELGVLGAFDETIIERVEDNIGDRDSMMVIISETFWTLDEYFKENDRESISALIVAGGWIEGLYLTTQLYNPESPEEELITRIAEQKLTLGDLANLLASYSDDQSLADVLQDVQSLQAIYEGVTITKGPTTTSIDPEDGELVLDATTKIDITKEQLLAIQSKAKELRTKYTD
jgi:hypothetical protein